MIEVEIDVVQSQRDEERDLEIIESLGRSLSRKRQKAIDARVNAGIDKRWFDDVEAYEGRDEVTRNYSGLRDVVQGYVDRAGTPKRQRSTLVPNVTRQKVNTSAARRCDIALPSDDRNWDLKPSTVPELASQMMNDTPLTKNGAAVMVDAGNGQQRQATMADLAKQTHEQSKQAAIAMRDEIDDQLDMSDDGCGFEGVIRSIIFDSCLLGVGVIKGPVVTSRTKKVWIPTSDGTKTIHQLSRIQEFKPVSSRVDPWDFYPHQDCGENVKKCAGTWERSRVIANDIRQMADMPGYILGQLKKVLMEGPVKAGEQKSDKPGTNVIVDTDTIFEQWEYHGELDRETLEAAGCICGDEGVFDSYSACVIMINDTVVKADIEILDTNELPYDVYCVNKASGSWAGYGEAFLARSAQKVITAAWRTMMDNAGQFVGGQIVMDRNTIEPADDNWVLEGMKAWFYTGEGDVRNAFAVHEIPSHQAEYAAIIQMGMDFLDKETATPQLAQGDQGNPNEPLGGMELRMNAANVIQRLSLKMLDDQVIIPHIGRYVDWNMQYSKKPEIKGDFEVQARASGALMDTDIQNRGAQTLLAIATNPIYAHGMKKWDAVRRVIKSLRYDPKDFVLDDDDIKQKEEEMARNPQSSAPAVEAAKIRADAQIQVEQLQAKEESDHTVAQAQLALQRQQFEAQQAELDRQNALVIASINERMQNTQLTSGERQNLDKIKATLAQTSAKLKVQQDLSVAGHAVALHKSKQVMQPPTEPKGRAPDGNSFQA